MNRCFSDTSINRSGLYVLHQLICCFRRKLNQDIQSVGNRQIREIRVPILFFHSLAKPDDESLVSSIYDKQPFIFLEITDVYVFLK